ncbi:MAG TPA: hemerythrin domain-containing protein [Steroidobacteraceae bacterium]|jgi:hypothetical protein|nr:hemerythrin domain-containing protein [Steroidobacteraceae bacterium]
MDTQLTVSLDAIDLLKTEHHQLVQRLGDILPLQPLSHCVERIDSLCAALKVHMIAEREIFYPEFLHATHDTLSYLCASINDESVKNIIDEVENADPGDLEFSARVHELYILFAHHAKDAEKPSGLFDAAQHSALDRHEVGRAILMRKRELEDELVVAQ